MKNKNKNQKSQTQNSYYPLIDLKQNGKKRPWQRNRDDAMVVSKAYEYIPGLEHFAKKIAGCGNYLKMMACVYEEHGKTLTEAYFCKSRMCTMCQWRRSLVIRNQVKELIQEHKKKFPSDVPLLLTVTVVNEKGEKLKVTLDHMNESWKRLMELKDVKRAVRSWIRCLEVTYNEERDDYHPHFHALLMVPESYFRKNRGLYIPHEGWLRRWQQSTRDDRITQIDIRPIKNKGKASIESIVAEVVKYATKPSSYIFKNKKGKKEADPKVIEHLHHGLRGRRLIGFGGQFTQIRKEKKMAEVEKADLVNAEENNPSDKCSCKICKGDLFEEIFLWNQEKGNYFGRRVTPIQGDDDSHECEGNSHFSEDIPSSPMTEEEIEQAAEACVEEVFSESKAEENDNSESYEEEEWLSFYKTVDQMALLETKKKKKPSILLEFLKKHSQKRRRESEDLPESEIESSLILVRGPP